MDHDLEERLRELARGSEPITVLTGAGISAESGIPTFRGPEGYWTVGSKVYHPQEMATFSMFTKAPDEVWKWYLYRMAVCGNAEPNPGHLALVEMEKMLGDRFTLITQNVDGLHLLAGNSPGRTFQIHGNVFHMRCCRECGADVHPIPGELKGRRKEDDISEKDRELLVCPACGGPTRPHVLWFDETYNEEHFRFHSSMEVAARTALLLIVGTAGATNLPNQVAMMVKNRGGAIVDVNIERNPFSNLALSGGTGWFVQEKSGSALPRMAEIFRSA